MRAFGYDLDPTTINEEAIEFFTQGQCWALAEALTCFGLQPVIEFWSADEMWCHVLAEHHTGWMLDINGWYASGNTEWTYRYPDHDHRFPRLANDCCKDRATPTYYRRRSLEVARAFIPTVINTYGYPAQRGVLA